MPKNRLLPDNIHYLLESEDVTNEELQSAHRRLDGDIITAERYRSYLKEDVDEAKLCKLRLKEKMDKRGIKPIKRKHIRLVA